MSLSISQNIDIFTLKLLFVSPGEKKENMANFAHNDNQTHAVNLDNVDMISKFDEDEKGYEIHFFKQLGTSTTILTRWSFDTQETRDHAFRQIIGGHSGPHFGYSNDVAVFE